MTNNRDGKSVYIKEGYQPGKSYEKGYQPGKEQNGYQPSTVGESNPKNPPTSGSGESKKDK